MRTISVPIPWIMAGLRTGAVSTARFQHQPLHLRHGAVQSGKQGARDDGMSYVQLPDTLDRGYPSDEIKPVSREKLERIKKDLEEIKIPAEVYC